VARYHEVGHETCACPAGGVAGFESEIGEACAALTGGGEEFAADVDSDHAGLGIRVSERKGDLTGAAADIDRMGEDSTGRGAQQAFGQRREAAVGALPFSSPGAPDAPLPFGLVRHECSLLGCGPIRRGARQARTALNWRGRDTIIAAGLPDQKRNRRGPVWMRTPVSRFPGRPAAPA
jgi:hypothetical protein